MSGDGRTRATGRRGPALMLAGVLLAVFGGLTFSDCFLCTLPEVGSWWGGTLVFVVGAVIRQSGRGRSRLAMVGIALAAAAAAYLVTPWLRLGVTGLLMGGV